MNASDPNYFKDYMQKRHRRHKLLGVCRNHKDRPVDTTRSTTMCTECLEKHRLRQQEYAFRKTLEECQPLKNNGLSNM